MTALKIAIEQCANYQTGGSCLGAVIGDDLQIRCCCPRPDCRLATLGLRCEYFEQFVAPMVRGIEPLNRRRQWENALAEYRRAGNVPSRPAGRLCSCGKLLDKGKRLCADCRDARRRATWRKSSSRARTGDVMSTDNQK